MISRNICVFFTIIGFFISVEPMPKYVASFKEISCNFSWTDDIKNIHSTCNVDVPRYVPPDVYLCAGLLQKSQDLCLLLKNLNTTAVFNKKPNIDIYDSNICTRFKDFAINSSDTNWISEYNKYFSSNSSCLSMCVDVRGKVNPLCQYTMWVTDEFNKMRNKSVNEGAHAKVTIRPNENPKIKKILDHNKTDLNIRLHSHLKTKIEQDQQQNYTSKPEMIKHNKTDSIDNATRNDTLTKIPSILTSDPSVTPVSASIALNITLPNSSAPIKTEASAKQSHLIDLEMEHSVPIINDINVTDREMSFASDTVRTTTKQNNPSDNVLDKSEIIKNIPLKSSTSQSMISDNVDEATGNEMGNTGEFTGQDDDLDETEVKEPSADGGPSENFNRIENIGPALEENEIDTATTVDQFIKPDDSHFFAYFITMMVLCIIGYLVFHNKQKILALALEGRSRRSRRRPNTSGYRKLDSNLEEAITSSRSSSATNVIY